MSDVLSDVIDGDYRVITYSTGHVVRTYIPPPQPELIITLDKHLVQIGETVTATGELRLEGELVPLSATYWVPVFDIDGRKVMLLEVAFEQGQASAQMAFTEAGIYSIDLTRIEPTPTAQLAMVPKIIVRPAQ